MELGPVFKMKDDLANLHEEHDCERWRLAYANRYSKEVEGHYRGRLVAGLEALGLGPVEVCGANDPIDLVVGGHAVELKVTRATEKTKGGKTRREYYQALLHDPGNRHNLNGDLVIVLCVDRADRLWPFVIPRLLIGSRRTVEITSHPKDYRGQWARYLEAWALLGPMGG